MTQQELSARVETLQTSLAAAGDDRERLRILRDLVVQHEALQRVTAGLPQHHALTMAHLFFPHSAAILADYKATASALVDRDPSYGDAVASKVMAMVCSKDDRTLIEKEVARLRAHAGKHIFASVTFDPGHYLKTQNMSEQEIVGSVMPMQSAIEMTAGNDPIIMLSCDYPYCVAFAVPMLRSLAAQGGGAVHLHIMDCGDKISKVADFCASVPAIRFGLTFENPGVAKTSEARNYYHAVRFIRLYQLLLQYRRPIWLTDVDGIFNRPPREIFDRFSGTDLAFRIRPGRLEPWNQFNACMVGVQPTEAATSYLRRIAAFIAAACSEKTLRWGIDQFAMYGVYDFLSLTSPSLPSIAFLDEIALDYLYNDDGVLWCNSGADKFAHVRRRPGDPIPESDLRHAKYLAKFDQFRLV